ncbi:MAG: homocysteine S-methyltransferase family protein [Reyranella sp.]|nr:homocysteine S-methyltransferase family protein [Reyranella sp.]
MRIDAKYRQSLPHLGGGLYLTDGGIETSLIFQDGLDLPYFAAFHLLRDAPGRAALVRYYERYIEIAKSDGMGFILESPTWRASADWGAKLGYSAADIAAVNRHSIQLMDDLREAYETMRTPMIVSGCVGPRGDGYDAGQVMSAADAEAGADMVSAITMTNANEAIGVAHAAAKAGMPASVSFTVETDGRLPTGQTLAEAIGEVDAATSKGPAYYMINCAHPTHFDKVLQSKDAWTRRIGGIRANASRCSHQELNESPVLDAGDPIELGGQYRNLVQRHPGINVLGGCCGTDERHVAAISLACRLVTRKAA